MRRFVFLFSLLLVFSIVLTPSAFAHARFDHSTPSPGQVVASSPASVDIFTVQDMRKTAGANEITVSGGPAAARADGGATVVDDSNRRHFSVPVQANLPVGRYVVAFKTLSDEDSESDQGQFAFYVGTGATTDQKAQDAKLALTARADDEVSASHTNIYPALAIGAALAVLAAGAFVFVRRRRTTG